MRLNRLAAIWLLGALVAGCGGGGSSATNVETPGSDAAGFPTLVQSAGFSMPAPDALPARTATPGFQKGEVLVASEQAAPAGLLVELLDASQQPLQPVVLASARTQAGGAFSLPDPRTAVSASRLWLRVTLTDGSQLRAFASGWTSVTPGTEAALAEIHRLQLIGAFPGRELSEGDLAGAQQDASTVWEGSYGNLGTTAAVKAVVNDLRTRAAWNAQLGNLASASPEMGSGDVAGMLPVNDVSWTMSVVQNGVTTSTPVTGRCDASQGLSRFCSLLFANTPDVNETYGVQRAGVSLNFDPLTESQLEQLLGQMGPLPLMEFPLQVGTRVLVDEPRVVLQTDNGIHASVKITRYTYPLSAVQALGTTVSAARVVVDYEIAMLDTRSNAQADVLVREQRWFSPGRGPVRIEADGLLRSGGTVTHETLSVSASSVSGEFLASPAQPLGGAMDVASLGLRHRHAVHNAITDKLYVAAADQGGRVLEMDPATLTTLRGVSLGAIPGRLAVSSDGRLLYVGLDGGQVVVLDIASLTEVRRFVLPSDPYGRAYDRVRDLAVDPFDSSRVLVLAGSSQLGGDTGAVLMYRGSSLVLRDAPRYNAEDYGWGYYWPQTVSWTSVQGAFLVATPQGSPGSLYRIGAGDTAYFEQALLERTYDLGTQELNGEILTNHGSILDALTLETKRHLTFQTFSLNSCMTLVPGMDWCDIGNAASVPSYLLMSHQTGDFMATYTPVIRTITNGCPEVQVRVGSLGLDEAKLSAMDHGRVLVSTVSSTSGTERCSLQVWSPQGFSTLQ